MTQEHHAFVAGVLASAWSRTRLDPRLVQVCGLHDTPWRASDRDPSYNPKTGLPHDFITLPMDEKVELYRDGIDVLEDVAPYAAYMVSLHYTTFSGTRNHAPLTEPEADRRRRLAGLLSEDVMNKADSALEWIKFFDIFSLFLCLTGPRAVEESIPRWLRGDGWQTSPDGVEMDLRWDGDRELEFGEWPFVDARLEIPLSLRGLGSSYESASEMRQAWDRTTVSTRRLTLRPAT